MKNVRVLPAALLVLAFAVSCASAPPAASTEAGIEATQPDAGSSAMKDRARELVTGRPSGSAGSAAATTSPAAESAVAPSPATPVASDDVPPPAPGDLSADERAYLERYLAGLDYLVYYDETAGVEPGLAKTAVAQANRYLIERLGLTTIDFDQIERNKKDQQAAYMAETGGSIGIVQYLAQKFNADVYVELSLKASNSSSGGRFYASAQGSMKLYDTSTSQLLGSLAFQSPQVMSPVSVEEAVANAVAASIWNAMPVMTAQAKSLIGKSLSNGVRYEVQIQKTPDARGISTLRRALGRSFRLVEQTAYSPDETRLLVYTFKSATEVEDAIYDAAERSGMPDLYLVFSRGKALTFNSGL